MKTFRPWALFVFLAFCPSNRAELIHRYSFNEAPGDSLIHDSVGTAHGTLIGPLRFENGALDFPGVAAPALEGFVTLPAGMISSLTNMTLETWVTWRGPTAAIQKIVEFGNSAPPGGPAAYGLTYVFLAPNTFTGESAFTVALTGLTEPQAYASTAPLGTDFEFHLAGVYNYSQNVIQLFINGQLAGSGGAPIPLRAIVDTDNWLGRSHYGASEGTFNGLMNEFRIYNHPLTPEEVRDSYLAGPHRVGLEFGTLKSLELLADPTLLEGEKQQAKVIGTFSKQTNVDLTADPFTSYSTANSFILEINSTGKVTALTDGTTLLKAHYQSMQAEAQVTSVLRKPASMVHRYDFVGHPNEVVVPDLLGSWHGNVSGTGFEWTTNGQLRLSGTGDYVLLPEKFLSRLTEVSLELWFAVESTSTGIEHRLFDFGSGGIAAATFYFTPVSTNGVAEFGIFTTIGTNFSGLRLEAPTPLLDGEHHVTVTYSTNEVKLYLDGQRVAQGPAPVKLPDFRDANGWLGKSQGSHPPFGGMLNELRLYGGVLTPAQVQDHFESGPNGATDDAAVRILNSETTQTSVRLVIRSLFPTRKHAVRTAHNLNFVNGQNLESVEFKVRPDGLLEVEVPRSGVGCFYRVFLVE